jgi:23S rRNA pseudouridine1911/1915/1917 synthase
MSAPRAGWRTAICPIEGVRVDRFIGQHLAPLGRRRISAIIAAGAVRVNGRDPRKGERLHAGDVVEVEITALAFGIPVGQPDLDVAVLYDDAALIAVDKPAGMASVALRASDAGTVANFLLGYAPGTATVGRSALEGGLAHRLDTGTSGVLLAARTPAAWWELRAQFRARNVRKRYLAVVDGDLAGSGSLCDPIAHHPRRAGAMIVCPIPARAAALGARPASTRFRPLARWGRATLLSVVIATGVRHQIRAHLAAAGHPVCGDSLYGGSAAPRLMLHARALSVRHPTTGASLHIASPVPAALRDAVATLPDDL